MGAAQFSNFRKGTNPGQMFGELVADALYEYGHGGYTGTIAEKQSFEIRNGGKPITMKEARDFTEEDGEDNDKWGPAYAVAICADANPTEIIGYLFYGLASE